MDKIVLSNIVVSFILLSFVFLLRETVIHNNIMRLFDEIHIYNMKTINSGKGKRIDYDIVSKKLRSFKSFCKLLKVHWTLEEIADIGWDE